MKKYDIRKIKKIKAKIKYEDIIDKHGQRATDILRDISPDSGRNRATPYKKGWVADDNTMSQGYRVVVWNKTNWQLTHLLENGHFITNGKNFNIYWSAPIPHIAKTYRKVRPGFLKDMRKPEIEFEIK